MTKTKSIGRPKGEKKEPMNLSIGVKRARALRLLAVSSQKTISIMVENALEAQYKI